MSRKETFQYLFTIVTLAISCCYIVGCGKKHHDDLRDLLSSTTQSLNISEANDVQQLIQMALRNYENDISNPEPILIAAILGSSVGTEQINLALITYDEDEDIFGIGIDEHYIDADGLQKKLTEEYPVFIYRLPYKDADFRLVPVQIRNSDKRKSVERWQKYIIAEGIDRDRIKGGSYWRETLPDVWISLPDPNKVEVNVYLYDKAGHKSNSFRLINHIDLSNRQDE